MSDLLSIGNETAIELANSNWWKGLPAREVAGFQLFTQELCMDFGDFHAAVEESLGRPVWTHEFGFADGLRNEFLGKSPRPTLIEIIEMIPEEKRCVLFAEVISNR